MPSTTSTRDAAAALSTPFAGLHASPAATLPFAPDHAIRAFVLERDGGNLLVGSAPSLLDAAGAVRALGGVAWQYLGHWHEAMFAVDRIAAAFGAPVLVHADDAGEVVPRAPEATVTTFAGRHALGDGFELVPIPGHTPGATAFLWEHGDHRFLFTGDSVILRGGEWVGAVLGSSDRAAYLDSLELLATLDFDVLVPWAASADGDPWAPTDRADARRRLEAIARRVRAGGDG